MKRMTPYRKTADRLCGSLATAIEQFRKGNDIIALESFQSGIEDLEYLLELEQYLGMPWEKTEKIIPVLQTLCRCMESKDVIAMTDVLEFELCPLTEQWLEEVRQL